MSIAFWIPAIYYMLGALLPLGFLGWEAQVTRSTAVVTGVSTLVLIACVTVLIGGQFPWYAALLLGYIVWNFMETVLDAGLNRALVVTPAFAIRSFVLNSLALGAVCGLAGV